VPSNLPMPTYLLVAGAAAYAVAAVGGFWTAVRLAKSRILKGVTHSLVFNSRWHWMAQPVLSLVLLLAYRHWAFVIPLAYEAAYWGMMASLARGNVGPRHERLGPAMFPGVFAVASLDPRALRKIMGVMVLAPTLLAVLGLLTVAGSAAVVAALRMSGPNGTASLWWLIPLLVLVAALVCWMASALADSTPALVATWLLERQRRVDETAPAKPSSTGSVEQQLHSLKTAIGRMERQLLREEYGLAILTSNEIVAAFGSPDEAEFAWRVALAMCNKGVAMHSMDRWEEGIAVFDEVARLYGDRPDVRIRHVVATALFRKGIGLGRIGLDNEAADTYGTVVDRYRRDDDPRLRKQCARALWFKAVLALEAGRRDEAFVLLHEAVKSYPDVRFDMAIDSNLAPLKDDERWASLLLG